MKKTSMRSLFFRRSFVKNFMLLMLPLSIISAYSLYNLNKETTENIESRNWNLMYQIKTQGDSMFQTVDIMSSFLLESASINSTLQAAFLKETLTYNTTKQVRTISLYLQSIIDSNEYAYSSYLYYDNEFGRYIATSNGLSYMRNYSNDNWLESYNNSSEDMWCETKKISTYSQSPDKDVITIYKKIYSPYSITLPEGVLIVNYSFDSFMEYISNFDLYEGQIILFLRENELPLFQTAEADFKGIWSSLLPNILIGSNYQTFSIEYSDISYMVSLIRASEEGYYYVSMIPRSNLYQQNYQLIWIFLIIASAACVLSAFLAHLNARHEYNQLQNIIDVFDNVSSKLLSPKIPVKKTDPYQVILDNVISLFLEQHYLKLQIDNKQYQLQMLELRSLQHQINPHFLYNTLNTIYWEAFRFTQKPNTCSCMISDLSAIMAYSLTDVQEKVTISKELEYLQHYTNIQEIRYNHKFEVVWDIDDEAVNAQIIKMVLQPLVENAIYHGIGSCF